MKLINIVIPCYNEEKNIAQLYKKIKETTDGIENYKFDFIFVDDGSKDNTLEAIKKLSDENTDVGFIRFSRNFGKEAAMHAGLVRSENKDALIFIDADLQHNPKYIKDFILYYEEGYKIVYTKKRKRNESFIKKLLAKIFYKIFYKMTKLQLESGVNDYQLLDKMAIKSYISINDKERFLKGIFSYVGFNKKCIIIDIDPRFSGKTTWNFRKLFNYAFNGINQFSDFLLLIPKVSSYLVILVAIFNVCQYLFLDMITLNQMIFYLQLDLFFFLMFLTMYFILFLIYNTRKEIRERPIFIVEEEKINDEII